jgi:SAM-dependent methyltransferase
MSSFSAEWLALREPYDGRARNPVVLNAVVASAKDCLSMRIVDLGSGIGSTLLALAPRLEARQVWRLVDNDLELLTHARKRTHSSAFAIEACALDLNCSLQDALNGPIDLVTAFALLDLVSETWLERLVCEIVRRSIPIYATLTYDGRAEISPADPLDAAVVAAVNTHQRTDKGFGPALGPAAGYAAIAQFESMKYSVVHGASDWVFGPDDREMQMRIFASWASAARETRQISDSDMVGWLARRRDAVIAACSFIRVGHVDFFAMPVRVLEA